MRLNMALGAPVILCALVTNPSTAQTVASPVAAPAPAPTCELHAWPGRDFHTTYYGWTHGGTTDASLTRRTDPALVGVPMQNSGQPGPRKGYPPIDVDTLPATRQAEILRTANLTGMLGLSNYRATVHEAPLTGKAVRATVGRHEPQSGECYAELLVEGITLQADYATGKYLNVLYRLRRFRAGDAPEFTFGTFVTARITTPFSGKDTAPPEQLSASAATAFAESIATFGAAARKAAARAGHPPSPTRGKQ